MKTAVELVLLVKDKGKENIKMQAIKPFTEIFGEENEQNIVKKIEKVARTCYKSEDKITEQSAHRMVGALIKREHDAMLEHGTYIIKVTNHRYSDILIDIRILEGKGYFKSYIRYTTQNGRYILSGNIRAWRNFFKAYEEMFGGLPAYSYDFVKSYDVDKQLLFGDLLKLNDVHHSCSDIEFITKEDLQVGLERNIHFDITVKFIVDRGVSHEIVRHRDASFAQESTRYCNYGNNEYGVTFIIPCYLKFKSDGWKSWIESIGQAEKSYLEMLENGFKPEQARAVLPNSLKTEIIMTANVREWVHFFDLRALDATGKAHPQIKEVSIPLLEDMKEVFPNKFDHLVVGG